MHANAVQSSNIKRRPHTIAFIYLEFFGPQWHSPIGSMPFHRAQKTLDFQNPTPSHKIMDAARIKSKTHGAV